MLDKVVVSAGTLVAAMAVSAAESYGPSEYVYPLGCVSGYVVGGAIGNSDMQHLYTTALCMIWMAAYHAGYNSKGISGLDKVCKTAYLGMAGTLTLSCGYLSG